MSSFPATFTEVPVPALSYVDKLDKHGQRALIALSIKGYDLSVGVCRDDITGILPIAECDEVVEYCPKDATDARFLNPTKWLQKGRQAFVLRNPANQVVGYSWTGPEVCRYLPDYPITTAFRCIAHGIGSQLVAATISLSNHLHGPVGHGLETWASNARAVNSYLRCGAVVVRAVSHEVDESGVDRRIERPTIQINQAHRQRENGTYMTYDTRLYMAFPWTLPPSNT